MTTIDAQRHMDATLRIRTGAILRHLQTCIVVPKRSDGVHVNNIRPNFFMADQVVSVLDGLSGASSDSNDNANDVRHVIEQF